MCEFWSKEVTVSDPKTGKTQYTTVPGEKKRDCHVKKCPMSNDNPRNKKW